MLTVFGPYVQPYFDFGVGAARDHVGSFFSTFPGINGTIGSHTVTRPAIAGDTVRRYLPARALRQIGGRCNRIAGIHSALMDKSLHGKVQHDQ